MAVTIGIVGLVLSFGITAYVVGSWIPTDHLAETEWRQVAVFFGLMLLGMLARAVYDSLVNKKTFNWISLAIAGIVSPIVFGAVYG
ncbi:MAG: hypothetical protein ACREAE_08900, partial [Nitrosopumilaceae archaeon]